MSAAGSPNADCSSAQSAAGQLALNEKNSSSGPHLFSAIQQQYAAAAAAAIAANANAHQYQTPPYAQQQQSVADNATATPSELVGKKRSAETDIFQLVFCFSFSVSLSLFIYKVIWFLSTYFVSLVTYRHSLSSVLLKMVSIQRLNLLSLWMFMSTASSSSQNLTPPPSTEYDNLICVLMSVRVCVRVCLG